MAPLLFEDSSKDGIGGNLQNPIANVDTGKERGPSMNLPDPLEGSSRHLSSFPPHHLVVVEAIRPVAFVELKNPQTHPESISLGADRVGQRGFGIIIRTLFQSPTALVYSLVSFTHN